MQATACGINWGQVQVSVDVSDGAGGNVDDGDGVQVNCHG
jgi:hypothetical protein